ncbi:MAG: hypothetical protein L0241_10225 [Planctomycetia bacterium]|nr:hypothetical protein [Planctomycetia bacterium]
MRRLSAHPVSQRASLSVEELELRAQPAGLKMALGHSFFSFDHGSKPLVSHARHNAPSANSFTNSFANSSSSLFASPSLNFSLALQASILSAIHNSLIQALSELPSAPSKAGPADPPAGPDPFTPPSADVPVFTPAPAPPVATVPTPTPTPTPALPPTPTGTNAPGVNGQPSTDGPAQPTNPTTTNTVVVQFANVIALFPPDASLARAVPGESLMERTEPPVQEARPAVRTTTQIEIGYAWTTALDEDKFNPAAPIEVAPPPRAAQPKDELPPPVEVAPPPRPIDEAPITIEVAPEEQPAGVITTTDTTATSSPATGATTELFAVAPLSEGNPHWTWLAATVGVLAAGYWTIRRSWLTPAWEALARRWAALKARLLSAKANPA